ncbi:MAG: hypothetical protein OXC60_08325 [Litoreibacter sp.]|nr:hypothetical protein [Litoreibacter sp.]MCY4334663.1 hypothetical protein [Litoreibacter sp.]
MEPVVIHQLAARVYDLLGERLGAKGDTLEKRLKYAGRKLPRSARRAGYDLARAQDHIQHPKLAITVDGPTVSKAYDRIVRHLTSIDVAAERSRKRYNFAAQTAAQMLVVAGATVGVFAWQGIL